MKTNPRSRAGAALHFAKEKPACERCSKRKFQLLHCDFAPPHQHASAHRRKGVSASAHTLSEPPTNMASDSKKTASTTECKASQEDVSKPFRRKLSKDSKAIGSIAACKQENVPHSCSSASAVIKLKEDLRTNTDLRKRLQAEINLERQAAFSAASEAMAMIARLREEKAAVLVESQEFKRMAEEREVHDREAISRLKEMLFNKDEVTIALEKELQTYRQMFLPFISGMAANLDSADLDACISRSDNDSSHLHSMYVRKCNQTNFRSLVFDDARSNLISCFNQAGEVQERGFGEQPISDEKTNHEISAALGNTLGVNSKLEECETESVEAINIWRKVYPLRSFGKTLFIADELLERGQEEQNNMSPIARTRKLEKVIVDNSLGPKRRYLTEYPFPGNADTERPLKFHCNDGTSEFKIPLHGGRIETPVEMLSGKREENSIRLCDSNAHDNEENELIDSHRTDSTDRHNSKHFGVPLVIDNCSARHSSSFKDTELAEGHSNFPQPSMHTCDASTAFSRAEIERVHALETERSHMNDVRLTLQRENEDLKVFPAVAQALYNLRDEATPHSAETVKLDQPLFSLFEGFSTLLQCRTNLHERGPSLLLQSTGPNPIPKRYSGPGLSYLLEKSPDVNASRMMTKGTKVRVPHMLC